MTLPGNAWMRVWLCGGMQAVLLPVCACALLCSFQNGRFSLPETAQVIGKAVEACKIAVTCDSGVKGDCCPHDWLFRDGFCYKLNDQLKTWNDSEMFCRKLKPGCHLASIHSMAQLTDLAEYISDYIKSDGNVWIGMNDAQHKHVWEWTDRSYTNYFAWGPGEPNNKRGDEYCVELIARRGYIYWNDGTCDILRVSICQCKY